MITRADLVNKISDTPELRLLEQIIDKELAGWRGTKVRVTMKPHTPIGLLLILTEICLKFTREHLSAIRFPTETVPSVIGSCYYLDTNGEPISRMVRSLHLSPFDPFNQSEIGYEWRVYVDCKCIPLVPPDLTRTIGWKGLLTNKL